MRANAAARELLGLAPGVPVDVEGLLPDSARQLAAACAATCLPRCRVRRADGTEFPARVQLVPVSAVRGTFLMSIEDLSAHERALAAGDREFEALTSAAGHDLRGPLRILKGFAEALDDEHPPSGRRCAEPFVAGGADDPVAVDGFEQPRRDGGLDEVVELFG